MMLGVEHLGNAGIIRIGNVRISLVLRLSSLLLGLRFLGLRVRVWCFGIARTTTRVCWLVRFGVAARRLITF